MFDFFVDVIVIGALEVFFRMFGITEEARKMKISNYVAWGIIALIILGLIGLFVWANQ